jgi:hypothetical protein
VGHVVLLGDSIFDNGHYVPGGPSVIEHLRRGLPSDWSATLLAVDGSVADGVAYQLGRMPADATHLVISTGGNNALEYSSMIRREPALSFREVLTRLGAIRDEFRQEYRAMLRGVLECGKPSVVCTVYDAIPDLDPAERTGLCLFNDVILREAFGFGVPVIDLRMLCTEPLDYARSSPIEPSAVGGGKIAAAVIRSVTEAELVTRGSRVFT